MNKLYKFLLKVHKKLATDSFLFVYKNGDNKMRKIKNLTEIEELQKDKDISRIVFASMSNDALEEFYYWILFKKSKDDIQKLLETGNFDESYFVKFSMKNGKLNTYTFRQLDYVKIKDFDKKLEQKIKEKIK